MILDFFGRLHPLILHLPIGFLAIAFFMQLARKEAFKPAIEFTLKWGMLSALFAAGSGYFLSQEGGYNEDLLFWHKWVGIGTGILSLVVYQLFKKGHGLFRPTLFLTMAFLAVTGHYGGSLTHGSDFLTEPFRPKEIKPVIVNIDEAHVYQDFIQPIFNEKCNSCHNESKQKGELLMTSKEGILKGGKTGVMLVAGDLAASLMFKRIHLDPAEKKHMPPKGKKQLTEEEVSLLEWWVKEGASFEKKVGELKTPEPVQKILSKYVEPEKDQGVFALEIDAASESRINKLSALGFQIYPIAKESPFLDASFPKHQTLEKSTLKKLRSVSDQLVRLDLSASVVNDDMLSVVNDLPHLQKLMLQNSKITDKGLRHLEGLEYLEYLNLYGTNVTDAGIAQLPELPRLRQLFIWQTKISNEGIATLQNKYPYLKIDKGVDPSIFGDAALMPPLIIADKDIFKDSLEVELKMNFKGANVYYTVDGSMPDSNAALYDGTPIAIHASTELKAIAQKAGWKISDPVSRFFPRAKYAIQNIDVRPKPHERYKGDGAKTLYDFVKGSTSFTDGKWLGYEKSHADFLLDLGEPKEVSRLTLGVMEDTGSYIFFPKGMDVSVSEDGRKYKKVVSKTYPTAAGPSPPELANFSETFDPVAARYIKVHVKSNLVNPDWHPAPGAGCWIFVDEVIVE